MQLNLPIKLCDFCVWEHMRYNQNLNSFKITDKVEVATCVCCWNSMCKDCIEASKKRTEWSFLSQNWFYLCAERIQKEWNEWSFRENSQLIYQEESQTMKSRLKKRLKIIWSKKENTSNLFITKK